ncbi:fimbrillin family protein [Bacteroides xylanisolvens]|uniref:fimbrillin family protein n=1 Tax=Bacteroides xylanisolvens TaxID=371601 RepID=UPI00230766C9|nr:fimbrillin family protein [Bacteroides xylanisolvens]MDB0715771.1 fimbrillin family protein [Bacteroides xylanisolvens]MDB0738438.1 fimbrillin family protein [Bacteroides xylanisolvens]
MKIYNYISMLFLAGAAVVASCSQNEELTGETPDSLQGFQISVSDEGFMDESGKTRATENGYTTRFSNGDAIGIFAVRGETVVEDIKNRKFTLTDGYWELTDGGDPIEYKGSQFQRMTFYAYYPYNANVTFDPTKVDPFETYVNNWKIGDEQNEGNYTQYDLMTSTGSVQGDRLKGQIAFTMQHRMALAVVKMPNLTYSFTNGGIDDYLLPLAAGSFTVNNTQATPYYQESTDTYRFLVNPNKEFSIKGTYTGVSEMEYEAKGTLEGGTAKMYTIEDKSKINHTLQVGDYFCADGKIVSVDAETVPESVIGIVCYIGNIQPSVTHEAYTETQDALRRDHPGCTHGLVVAMNYAEYNDSKTSVFSPQSRDYFYGNWFNSDDDWTGKFINTDTKTTDAEGVAALPFLGYNHTELMINSPSWENACQAGVNFVQAYRTKVVAPNITSDWFLASLKELDLLFRLKSTINARLKAVGGDELLEGSRHWSNAERTGNTQIVYQHNFSTGVINDKRRNEGAGYFRMMLAF